MNTSVQNDTALVLFSGGQDSTVCLAWALSRFARVETIGFDYGQRHRVELDARQKIRAALQAQFPDWAAKLGDDHMINLPMIAEISDTALTQEAEIAYGADGLPTTFVPGRNLLFFTTAAMVAYRRGLRHLVGGMCETDYSGYPDCRDDTLKALQVALNLGMARRMVVETPLMWLDKADTWALTQELGGVGLVALVRDLTVSCYRGDITTKHDWGTGCDDCPACDLRRKGWRRWRATRKATVVTS